MQIQAPHQVQEQPRRFYDGGLPPDGAQPEVPPDPDSDPRIVLERISRDGLEEFAMQRRIAYRDRHLGELLVPADIHSFRTDLTSVPTLFTWLVPKTGAHLPAALLHDGLIFAPGSPPTYTSSDGHVVDRVEADRVFRDAMADTGTGVIRRWLVWSAVATATMVVGTGTNWSTALRWRYRLTAVLTVLLICWLGWSASVDLFDRHAPAAVELPWMGARPWWLEVAGGLAGAIVVPLLLGLTWGRFRRAGWTVGIGLAVLLHVTVGILAVTALYQVVERLTRRRPAAAAAAAVLVVLAAVLLVVVLVAGAGS